MSRRSKVTDKLGYLEARVQSNIDGLAAISIFANAAHSRVDELDAGVVELARQVAVDVSILEARVDALNAFLLGPEGGEPIDTPDPGYDPEQTNIEPVDEDPPTLEGLLEDLKRREAFAHPPGPTTEDADLAWEITGSGARVFSAGGYDALGTVAKLLELITDSGLDNPSIIDINVSFGQVDEQGLGFDGLATVGF